MLGFLNVCHPDYVSEITESLGHKAIETLKKSGVSVIDFPGPITNHKQAFNASRKLIEADIDGVILFYGAFVLCPTVMTVLTETKLPVLQWAVPMMMREGILTTTGSYVAFSMFTGTLNRLGIPHINLVSEPDGEEAVEKVLHFEAATNTMKRLRRTRAGLVGYSSMSIYPGTFDHVMMRWFIGPEIHHIDSYTLINRAEAVVNWRETIALYEKSMRFPDNAPDLMIERAAKLYIALLDICKEEDLQAITVKCQYELSKEYGMTPCLPLSLLADQGIVTSCEGDIPCLISSIILNFLSGQTASYGDAIHHKGNILKLSPCGYMPFSLGNPGLKETKISAYSVFKGILCSFVMRPGRVTMIRLVENLGSYSILCFTGTGIESELRGGDMPALDVKLDGDMDKLIEQYPGQHFAICYGDVSQRVEMLAKLLNIEYKTI